MNNDEAIEKLAEIIRLGMCDDLLKSRHMQAAKAILAAILTDPMAYGIKPKPLVWGTWEDDMSLHTWNNLVAIRKAPSIFGSYHIGRKHKYIKSTSTKTRAFDSEVSNAWYAEVPLENLAGPFEGDVMAAAHCQKVYRERVLSAFYQASEGEPQ